MHADPLQQLRETAVLDEQRGQRVLALQRLELTPPPLPHLQHALGGAALRQGRRDGQLQLVEKHTAHLLRTRQEKGVSRQRVRLLLDLGHLRLDGGLVLLQHRAVHNQPRGVHVRQQRHEPHLDARVGAQLGGACQRLETALLLSRAFSALRAA